MINSLGQSQSITTLNGSKISRQTIDAQKGLFFILITLYIFGGKWKIFTIFRINTDYLFWAMLSCVMFLFVILKKKIIIRKSALPFWVYLLYQFFEMKNSAYSSYAMPQFVFKILIVSVFLFVAHKKGYDKLFRNCLVYGGLYYTITVLLQAAFPSVVNYIRTIIFSRAEVEMGLKGFQNTTNYLSGLATNSAVAAFFIAMMVGICISRVFLKLQTEKNLFFVFLGFIALFLTQKRSLALGTVLAIMLVVFIFKKGLIRKYQYFLCGLLFGGITIGILYMVMPAMTIFLNRIFQNQDFLSGRETMYDIMLSWYNSKKLTGVGLGTANCIFGYGGHNCYLQLLAEEGIIGCIVYASMVIPYISLLFKKLKYYWNENISDSNTESLLGGAICLVIILIYAFVGNPLYDYIFCLTFFMILAIPTQIREENE